MEETKYLNPDAEPKTCLVCRTNFMSLQDRFKIGLVREDAWSKECLFCFPCFKALLDFFHELAPRSRAKGGGT